MARCASLWVAWLATLAFTVSASAQPKAVLGFDDGTNPKQPEFLPTTPPVPPPAPMPPLPPKLDDAAPIFNQKDILEKLATPVQDVFAVDSSPFTGRWSIRADKGDGVGYTRGFTALEAMLPIRQGDRSILFADVRVVNLDDDERWEYNFGGGYRRYSSRIDRVVGVNAFYDLRKSDFHLYQQLGLGLEILSPRLEFRTNGYFIVGPAHRVIGDTGLVNVGVVNNNFVFVRQQLIEVARGGIEVEVGGLLPILERFAPRAYAGFYSYSAEGVDTANGVRGRLEAQLWQRVSVHFAIQHDRVFNTTVSGGLALHFGAPAYRRGVARPSWDDVLYQRVIRDINIVLSPTTGTTTATQPVPPPPPPPQPPPEEEER